VKQFILNSEPDKKGFVYLKDNDYNYLVRVRRLAKGEFFPALLPDGKETLIQVISIQNGILTGKCNALDNNKQNKTGENPALDDKAAFPQIILLQALPKADKMDLIVRQAAEGGIAQIIPFMSEFSIAKPSAEGQKFQRWEKIIKEARQQSGSKISTIVHKPVSLDEIIVFWKNLQNKNAIGILFHHTGLENKSLHEYLDRSPKIVVLAIGPEGGFSDQEVNLFRENGFKTLTIGDTILRTETAALYCCAAVKIILLERDSWELNKTKTDNV